MKKINFLLAIIMAMLTGTGYLSASDWTKFSKTTNQTWRCDNSNLPFWFKITSSKDKSCSLSGESTGDLQAVLEGEAWLDDGKIYVKLRGKTHGYEKVMFFGELRLTDDIRANYSGELAVTDTQTNRGYERDFAVKLKNITASNDKYLARRAEVRRATLEMLKNKGGLSGIIENLEAIKDKELIKYVEFTYMPYGESSYTAKRCKVTRPSSQIKKLKIKDLNFELKTTDGQEYKVPLTWGALFNRGDQNWYGETRKRADEMLFIASPNTNGSQLVMYIFTATGRRSDESGNMSGFIYDNVNGNIYPISDSECRKIYNSVFKTYRKNGGHGFNLFQVTISHEFEGLFVDI